MRCGTKPGLNIKKPIQGYSVMANQVSKKFEWEMKFVQLIFSKIKRRS